MFSEKNITITIGNYGVVVALHEKNSIKNNFFTEEFDDAAKDEIRKILFNNKDAPIYLLLDTIDQTYKKKIYPLVKKPDLIRIIQRDMAADGDKDSIKNYIILSKPRLPNGKKQDIHRWECLFVSSSNSEVINGWIEFFLGFPNRLVGIYMLPVEIFSLFKLLKKSITFASKVNNKKNDLYCFIIQNKAGGIRQVVVSSQGIIFTRVVNYDFGSENFLEKYEQDIYSTFEYLKRLFPTLAISELDIVNILPSAILSPIKGLQSVELNFVNYTPFQAAAEAGYTKLLTKDEDCCDLLIAKIFSKGKKILKFTTPKIYALERFFLVVKGSYYTNLLLLLFICFAIVFTIFSADQRGEMIEVVETEKFSAIEVLNSVKIAAFSIDKESENDDEETDDSKLKMIMDFGKTDEMLGGIGFDFIDFYIRLKFLKDLNVKLDRFAYVMSNFNSKSPTANIGYEVKISGNIINKSGDVEDLLREFDRLILSIKKSLSDYEIKSSELPRDIDFNEKYYKYPIEFSITKKQ